MNKNLLQFSTFIILVFSLFFTNSIFAQAPQKMSYQAVIRSSNNALVVSTLVATKVSILQGSSSGTVVYSEKQTPTTNINGLISFEIGTGLTLFGTFSQIDWSTGPYFVKLETDPTGGSNYTIIGSSELTSIPYALYTDKANNISGVVAIINGGTGAITILGAKTNLGLENVDNTSDINKPISTATQSALNLKANIASPTLTGVPAAPTAIAGTNTTQIATTAFVAGGILIVNTNLAAETVNRISGDAANATAIATNASDIATEVTRATSEEGVLTTNLTTETTNRITGDATNATAIATNTSGIATEVTRATSAEWRLDFDYDKSPFKWMDRS